MLRLVGMICLVVWLAGCSATRFRFETYASDGTLKYVETGCQVRSLYWSKQSFVLPSGAYGDTESDVSKQAGPLAAAFAEGFAAGLKKGMIPTK